MRGLLPRSLPSPIPHNTVLSSGSSCSLVCGDLRRLSPGSLCCSSKRSLAKSGFAVGSFLLAVAYLWAPALLAPWVPGLAALHHLGSPHPSTLTAQGGLPPPTTTVPIAVPASSWPLPPPSEGPTRPSLVSPGAQLVPPQKGVRPHYSYDPNPRQPLTGPTRVPGGTGPVTAGEGNACQRETGATGIGDSGGRAWAGAGLTTSDIACRLTTAPTVLGPPERCDAPQHPAAPVP